MVNTLVHVRSPYFTEGFISKCSEGPALQAPTAYSRFMKVLYTERLCRTDLLVGITKLAPKVTCWQLCHDRTLRRMFSYILQKADLPSPKPGHTTSGSGRGGAWLGRNGRRRYGSPREQLSFVPTSVPKTTVLNVSSEA